MNLHVCACYTHRMKELELEDRQYALDKELNKLMAIPGMWKITEEITENY